MGWLTYIFRTKTSGPHSNRRYGRTPYWLTSTRNPEELVSVLGGSMHVVDATQTDDEDIPEWLIEAERQRLEAEQAEDNRKQQNDNGLR